MKIIRQYYLLTKPGIIYGNAITAIAGFLVASRWHIHPLLFCAMLFGLSLVIGSSCVFNNILDREIDSQMERTKKRPLVLKSISLLSALIYGIILGIIGFALLIFFTNLFTAFIAFCGVIFYVIIYGFAKRTSIYSTVIGSISGAVPPVVGYTAVTNRFDTGALLLFLILVAWQMPHFYAIGIYRLKEYAQAGLPILPVKKGIFTTKIHILFWTILFVIATLLLSLLGYTGFIYLTLAMLLSLFWLGWAIKGFWAKDDSRWAKKMFLFSLIIITMLSLIMSINPK